MHKLLPEIIIITLTFRKPQKRFMYQEGIFEIISKMICLRK